MIFATAFAACFNVFAASSTVGDFEVIDGNAVLLKANDDGHFYVRAKINGKEETFLVDTGAFGVALDAGSASKMGLTPTRQTPVKTALGSGFVGSSGGNEISIGPLRAKNMDVAIIPSNASQTTSKLLGMEFLSRFNIAFNRRNMLITRPEGQ